MKKTLIAMAAVAVAGVASAQVTITGKAGVGFSNSGDGTTLGLTDQGIAFAASEDLGAGMSVSASMALANVGGKSNNVTTDGSSFKFSAGGASFEYLDTVAGSCGGVCGVGSLPYDTNAMLGGDSAGWRALVITLPALADGLSTAVRYSANVASGTDATSFKPSGTPQLRLGYTMGAITAKYNYTNTANDYTLSYNAGVATVSVAGDGKRSSGKRTGVSVAVPMGAVSLGISSVSMDTKRGTELDVQYALSKRTTLRGSFGSFSGVDTKSASRVKLVHTF